MIAALAFCALAQKGMACSANRRDTDAEGDEKTGVQIVAKVLEEPIRQIAANAGLDGSVILEKVRTSGKALARMVELAGAAADRARMAGRIVDIEVQHLDFAARATEVADSLSERVADAGEIRVGELGAVVGAHVGPGTLAITVSPRPEGGR